MSIHPVAKTLLILFGVWGTQQLVQAHRRREAARPRSNRAAVQTWEGEGGAVPVSDHRTAAEVSPKPGIGPR
jgi:hypothetical protein